MFLFLTITLPILHKCIYLAVKTTITMLNTYIYIDALILYWVQAIETQYLYISSTTKTSNESNSTLANHFFKFDSESVSNVGILLINTAVTGKNKIGMFFSNVKNATVSSSVIIIITIIYFLVEVATMRRYCHQQSCNPTLKELLCCTRIGWDLNLRPTVYHSSALPLTVYTNFK